MPTNAKAIYDKQYYLKNKQKIVARATAWAKNNRDKMLVHRKNSYLRNIDSIKYKSKIYRAEHPEIHKNYVNRNREKVNNIYTEHHWKTRGIINKDGSKFTVGNYIDLRCKQNNCCAICKKQPTKQRLHLDHDHSTGFVRALLCSNCNVGLGNFKDSVTHLFKAIKYLRSYK